MLIIDPVPSNTQPYWKLVARGGSPVGRASLPMSKRQPEQLPMRNWIIRLDHKTISRCRTFSDAHSVGLGGSPAGRELFFGVLE